MNPWVCLFSDPEQLNTFAALRSRFPTADWQSWGSDLCNHESEQFKSACFVQDDVGVAFVIEVDHSAETPSLTFQMAFPVVGDGVRQEVELLDRLESSESAYEGALSVLTARKTEVTFHDPDFAEHQHLLETGAHYAADLAGLVGSVREQAKSFEISKGPTIDLERQRRAGEDPTFDPATLNSLTYSMETLRTFSPLEEPMWYEFLTQIKNLRSISFEGRQGWRFDGVVEKSNDAGIEPLTLRMVLMNHIAGDYVPKEDDLIVGTVFLQGLLKEKVHHDGVAWADVPSSFDFTLANIVAMLGTGDEFSGAPPYIRSSAQLLAQAGWAVTSPEDWEPTQEHPPLLFVQRGDNSHTVGLSVNLHPAPACDIQLDVDCQPMGDGHQLKVTNADQVGDFLGLTTHELWTADKVYERDGED